ncbi:hypothetical protein DM860_015156 [Cuscuta australis]|uniref:Uncharacterized protein n=1 Tax=Cuscuta australis TaxID=267555 RepID=A0A328DCR6_9ASTE|nr:hypothetical protein DM860_015156 [Cuscuta australis]
MSARHWDAPPSHSGTNFDERRWVNHLRRSLEEEEIEEDADEIPVSIFSVPKTLMAVDPDSYVPQQVAIGPYHYWRPELYEMERYKVAAAKRIQKNLQSFKFHHLVEEVAKYKHKIRACYHKFLDCSDETLWWMMAVDASFLLEFLQELLYAIEEHKDLTRGCSSKMSHLVNMTGMRRKSTHNAILTDMVMLENQIPLFVLRKMLEFQTSCFESGDDILVGMLVGFCKEVSPFKTVKIVLEKAALRDSAHLLDVVYHIITPKMERIDEVAGDEMTKTNNQPATTTTSKKLVQDAQRIIQKINDSELLKRIVRSMPWKVLSNVPGLKVALQPIEYMCFPLEKEQSHVKRENGGTSNPPLAEEIKIPSVTELYQAGVNFFPINEGIENICFDDTKALLYLPCITLDSNTLVLLRNMVAYEAGNTSIESVVFTRYTELMNGIVDTKDDARILREKGIILNRLKSDEEVAELWNGMSRSIRLTKVPFLDKVIEDINKYYHRSWKVIMGNIMKRYVFGSWRFLTLLAVIMLLLLMSLQAFCSIFSCFSLQHVGASGTTTNQSWTRPTSAYPNLY